MGLFDKKYCDICGEKIGFLGNKKLEDGNMCKNCQNKLSPWFSERRHSTVAAIKEQLAYREENKARVAAFSISRSFGRGTKIFVDEGKKQLVISRYDDWRSLNRLPDVLDYDQVTGCDTEIRESKTEMMTKDADGKDVSYSPPRYENDIDFNMTLYLNSPYFDQVTFTLIPNIHEETPEHGHVPSYWHDAAYRVAKKELEEAEAFIRSLKTEE